MARRLPALAFLALLAALGTAARGRAAGEEPVVLEDGQSIAVKLAARERTWTARVDVPRDAVRLAVVLDAARDADLHLRRGKPAEGEALEEADAASATPSPHEVVVLTPLDTPGLRPGAWYVTVRNPWPDRTPLLFRVTAFVDLKGGTPTLMPGPATLLRLPAGHEGLRVRTYVPHEAVRATFALDENTGSGVGYVFEGEDGTIHAGTVTDRLILEPEIVPTVPFDMTLIAEEESEEEQPVRVQVTWRFPRGVQVPAEDEVVLPLGGERTVRLGGPEDPIDRHVRIPVETLVPGFVLEASSPLGVDVDLFVRRGRPPLREDEDADWFAASTAPKERLVVGGRTPLEPGVYHAVVTLIDDAVPVDIRLRTTPIPDERGPYTWGPTDPPPLAPDTWVEGTIHVDVDAVHWHSLDLPGGTRSVTVQLLDATGPLELVLVRGTDGSVLERAFTPLVNERLVVDFPQPLPGKRRFLLGVFNRAAWTQEEVDYRVAYGLDGPPRFPKDASWPPVYRLGEDATPLERAAAATVEVTVNDCSGGSGVCVNARGWVISCRHCLECSQSITGLQRARILVAFPRRLDEPPEQAYYARIWAEDEERDLVLLEPVSDIFGRPLPADVELPWLPFGDSEGLRLGEVLWALGYPADGSDVGRTPIVVSRGIFAGAERRPGRVPWFKTDAWIAPGHSGGPIVDGEGLLVGISAATLGTTESLGVAVPVETIPSRWVQKIRQKAP